LESNWRYGVWETGWTGGPYDLIARLLNPPPWASHIAQRRFGPFHLIYSGSADMLGWVSTWTLREIHTAPGFPYEWEVEPD